MRTATASTEPVATAAEAAADNSIEHSNSATASLVNTLASTQMILRVIEPETGQPLPNAKVLLAYLREDGRGTDTNVVTDNQGRASVDPLQPPFHYLNMFVTADGHVPSVTSFRPVPFPAEYTMTLARGITVGGIVTDEAGQPIAGAKVDFEGPGNDDSRAVNIQFGYATATTTDPDGRWTSSMIPKDFDQIKVLVSHPDYAETSSACQLDKPDGNDFRIVMKPGFTIAGVVRDSAGNPIAGATVRDVRWNSEGEHPQKTGPSGAFEFKSIKAGELLLAVQAEGFAPAVQNLQVTNTMDAVVFQLAPGQVLRGRVIDQEGHPITNAWVETLRTTLRKVEWQTFVDANGRFEWDSAPAEPLLYSIQVDGFQRLYALPLQADGSDHKLVLTPAQSGKDTIQISGTAVEAYTGVPLDTFKVLVSRVQTDWASPFRFETDGKEGQFSFSPRVVELDTNYQVLVEKDGYLPVITNLCAKDGNQTLDFQLQKGSGPVGFVRLPNGEPAANAGVYLCTSRGGVYLGAGGRVEQQGLNPTSYSAQTDPAGQFKLPAAVAPQGLVVVHDKGVAQLPVSAFASASNISITLQPWGRVEGALALDGQPVADQTIVAYNPDKQFDDLGHAFSLLSFRVQAKTDSAGRFSLEKVPPGNCIIFLQQSSPREPHRTYVSYALRTMVSAGEVANVTLGGGGRLVLGMAQLTGATNDSDWQGVPVSIKTKLETDPGPYPRRHQFSSTEAFVDAINRWTKAHEGAKAFWAFCDNTGGFRIANVPAGTYELQITLHSQPGAGFDDPSRDPNREQPEIASITRVVIVPPASDDQSGAPLDLGTLVLSAK
jgi:protocatechuate 3,4-dioxygenase beta subunit